MLLSASLPESAGNGLDFPDVAAARRFLPFIGFNTPGGLILVYIGGAMSTNIWLMKGFFDSIPRELDEAALVDGATILQTYIRIILPAARPDLDRDRRAIFC